MNLKKDRYYIVNSEILPEAIVKTAQVKKLLSRREAATVNEAVKKVGISRSAFYKYKDGVYPVHDTLREEIVTVTMLLEHRSGILSNVLNNIADINGNILTINQGIPLQGVANVSLSIAITQMQETLSSMLKILKSIPGVLEVEFIGNF
jgi:chorismate mutase